MFKWISGFFGKIFHWILPKPQTNKQVPAGINEVQVTTAEEGREIPVLFGTCDIYGPNVVWYGDFKTEKNDGDSGGGGKK